MARQTPPEARSRRPHREVRSRRRLRVARPSLRVDRSRHPATVCPDGWSPPCRRCYAAAVRNRIRLTGQLVPTNSLTCMFSYSRIASVRSKSEHRVNRVPCSVVRIRPQVAVGVQRLDRAGVAETRLNRLHALPVADEQTRVVVAQRMKPGPGRKRCRLDRRAPFVPEHRPGDRLPRQSEHQAVTPGRKLREMCRQRVHNDLRQGNGPVTCPRLGWCQGRSLPLHCDELSVHHHRALKESHTVHRHPEAFALSHSGTCRQCDERL
jgi:hypothetical protein